MDGGLRFGDREARGSVAPGYEPIDLSVRQVEMDVREVDLSDRQVEMDVRQVDLSGRQVEMDVRQVDLSDRQVEVDVRQVDLSSRQVDLSDRPGDLPGLSPLLRPSSFACRVYSTAELFARQLDYYGT